MTRKEWREQVRESAIEPDLPIIDAHHHVWEYEPYPSFEPYDGNDLIADKTGCGHNIVATVFTDSHTSYRTGGPDKMKVVGETEYAERIARDAVETGPPNAGICAAIVPGGDLLLGSEIAEVLDAHASISQRFRGIRHMTAADRDVPASAGSDPDIMMQPRFREGFNELARRELSFDAWLLQPQLPQLIDLANEFPDTTIILDHLGGPLVLGRFADAEISFASWKTDMERLAERPNVFVKLGGLNMGMAGVDALDRDIPFNSDEMCESQRGYVLTAIDLFGPHRCMFESNFPIDMKAIGYDVLWNGFKKMVAAFSPDEKNSLFFQTAANAYRLTLPIG